MEAEEAGEIIRNRPRYFTVQVGAFHSKGNAQSLSRNLKEKGFSAYIEETKSGAETLYRVRVGKWDTSSEARYVARKLRDRGFPTRVFP